MSFRNRLTENVILPLSDLVVKRDISSNLRLLQKSQWWSIDQIDEFQNEKLRKLIHYSYENVPYYKTLFDSLKLKPADIKNKEDLKKLPILTKDGIRNNFPIHIVDKNLKKGTFYNAASSGSTGEPLQYYLSKQAYSMNIASGIRGWYWMGYRLGDRSVKISQNIRKSREKKLQDIFLGNSYETLRQIDTANLIRVLKNLELNQPDVIRCYPDPLLFLAEEAKRLNIKIRPKAIATTGNILHSGTRDLIEEVFQCKVFDAYSCEGGATFFECPTHKCYHSASEYAISEFVDIHKTAENKYQGRLITTCLWNFAMPFIRYDSQDIIEWDDNKCECGREHMSIIRILGRDNDILLTPSGKRLILHIFTIYFSKIGSVKQFQVVQDKLNHILIKLVVNEKYNRIVEHKIESFWKGYIADDVKVDISVVDNIEVSISGKRRFLIRNPGIVL